MSPPASRKGTKKIPQMLSRIGAQRIKHQATWRFKGHSTRCEFGIFQFQTSNSRWIFFRLQTDQGILRQRRSP